MNTATESTALPGKSAPDAEQNQPSPSFLHRKLRSSEFHTKLLRGGFAWRAELEAAVNENKPRRLSPIRWVSGLQACLEVFWPFIHKRSATTLYKLWLTTSLKQIEVWKTEIDDVLRGGAKAETTVNGWLDHLVKGAQPTMKVWMPSMSGVRDIVIPPNEHNNSSQELDNLVVTDHGVYVIEVKSWHEINPNGGRVLPDGKELGSPVAQSKTKVEQLRKILGPDVPVKAIGVLPNLEHTKIPFGLDARIVTSLGEISLMMRGEHQRTQSRPRLKVQDLRAQIEARLDMSDKAKINHMRWLAEAHPNPEALRVRELDDMIVKMQGEVDKFFAPAAQTHSEAFLLASLVVPMASYFALKLYL